MDTVEVTFRFVGDHVNPQHVSKVTGLQPSFVGVKGEAVERRPRSQYPTNLWGINSNISPIEPISVHLGHLLDLLEPHFDAIDQLRKEGYKPNFFCGLFYTSESGYVMLDAQILERVARLGASIEINAYENGETG